MGTAYDPSSPIQNAFLASIQSGENSSGNPYLGYGGVDLTNASQNKYGFPNWSGASTSAGTTHAAGLYQFQPATWNGLASSMGLNFNNPADQSAGAWTLASNTYAAKTGGDLQSALAGGNFSSVASALKGTWSSISSGSLQTATDNLKATASNLLKQIPVVGGAISGITDGLGVTGQCSWLCQVQNWLSTSHFWQRVAIVILALLVIAGALYLLGKDNITKLVPTPA